MSQDKFCYNCSRYKPYYTKGTYRFDKRDLGLCMRNHETVEKKFTCENFNRATYIHRVTRTVALKALTENLNLIVEIKQILEEDKQDLIRYVYDELKE